MPNSHPAAYVPDRSHTPRRNHGPAAIGIKIRSATRPLRSTNSRHNRCWARNDAVVRHPRRIQVLRSASLSSSLEPLARNVDGRALAQVVERDTMRSENTMTNSIAGPAAIPTEAGESFDFGGLGVH